MSAAAGHRDASPAELVATVARLRAGQPAPDLVRRWVESVLAQEEEVIDSRHIAHALRCDETYVCWCCEVGVRLGRLTRCAPAVNPSLGAGVAPPREAWRRSTVEPLGRLALEVAFADAVVGTGRAGRAGGGPV